MGEKKPLVHAERHRYRDDAGQEKINLKFRLRGEIGALSSNNQLFEVAQRSLVKQVTTYIKQHRGDRLITNLPSQRFISVTEIDTGRKDFGQFMSQLLAHLEAIYDLKIEEKQ